MKQSLTKELERVNAPRAEIILVNVKAKASRMGKKGRIKKSPVQQEREYVEFLRKKLDSKNYKSNVSKEEYDKTKEKYEKAKFKLRNLE